MTKQLLAGLLALVMLFSLLSTAALAATAADSPVGSTQTDQPSSPYLNQEDHYAYIVGMPDGLVHPEKNITRAEVAVIFYRMLNDDVRSAYWTEDNSFPDVNSGDWYNAAVSTLANLGIFNGQPDGGFHPDDDITRAEFAAIVVRFFENTGNYTWDEDAFSDIAGHWANESINLAYLLDIIHGYSGAFRPGDPITRAETMTIVNNTLRREPSAAGFKLVEEDMITWPDNMDPTQWYYAAVQEATNSHEYTDIGGHAGEVWTALLSEPDWTALEQKWAAANSAAGPGEAEKVGDAGNTSTSKPGGSSRPSVDDDYDAPDEDGETVLQDRKTGTQVDFGSAAVEDMTVTPVDTVAALEGKPYVAYDITPYNADGIKYTGSAQVTLPLTVELKACANLTGFVVESDGSVTYIPGAREGDSYTFMTPHFSTVGVSEDGKTVTVSLTVGESVTLTETSGSYDSYSGDLNTGVATVSLVGLSGTAQAQLGSDVNYSGDTVPLSNALFTFTGSETSYTISATVPGTSTTVYLNPANSSVAQLPCNETAGEVTITVGGTSGSFTLQGAEGSGGRYLYFWRNGNNYFDRNGSTSSPATDFLLYRPVAAAESSSAEIPGYVQVTSTDGITSDGQYLITALYNDVYYVLYPSNSSTKYDHVGKVVSTDTAAPSTQITFTGVAKGNTTVTVGSTTYNITVLADEGDSGTTTDATSTIVYYPVTLYDYDQTTINNATHQVEVDNGLGNTWNGIYFGGGLSSDAYAEEISIEDGIYILQNARAAANNVGSWLVGDTSGITSTANQSDATQWTVKKNSDGTYTLNSSNGYMTIGSGADGEKTATDSSNIEIVGYTGSTYTGCVQLKSGDYYLCQWGGTNVTIYGGYNVNNDGGNAFYLYKVTDSGTEQVTFAATGSLSYAAWNFWTKGEASNDYGQYTYSGLVESTLTAAKDIVFTKPEGGIFNSDATVKDIYTNVEMPFVYENGTYTFDSTQNGAYFYEDSTQGSTGIQSNGRLYFNEGNYQSNGGSYGDGSTTIWMPFNSTQSIAGEGNCNYYFGMRATIPFTMTANGKTNPNDDTSEDITFTFSGDDDIWIFVDGQLVIDLGGIHNRLDATINFAENTWSISESNTSDVAVADYNGAAISGTLFNVGDTAGTLNQTRDTFAATDSHELTLFFLERGAGSSNCKIQFNLPAKDSVSIHKIVDKTNLTEQELEQVGTWNFNFTLYKKDAETAEYVPVVNTTYSLLNTNGQILSTPSTSSEGRFILQDGQTAKFIGMIDDEASYYVVEDAVEGFVAPTYTYTADVAGSVTETAESNGWISQTIQVTGSDQTEDRITFTCTNNLYVQEPPYAYPSQDWIVVDYGLPVVINPLHNDRWKGDITLNNVYGKPAYQDTDGDGVPDIDSDGNKTITGYAEAAPAYGIVTINTDNTFTYQLNKQLSEVDVLTYEVQVTESDKSATAYGLVYIIPATSMYYEEDFPGLVTYADGSSSGWKAEGTADNEYQETGYVRLTDTQPYGSDPAYLDDSGDSNGSSKYVDTTSSAASFSYTFTGTGTSFFARIDSDSAVISIQVKDSDGNEVDYLTRNTKYVSTDGTDVGTLYNIPVYTIDGLNYGTYTVGVTVLKAVSALNYGAKFYLDGIRVVNPLFDPGDSDYITGEHFTAEEQIALTSYAADGEANMMVATLRQKLLGEASINEDGSLSWNGGDFVVFTDSNGAITSVEEYRSNGPKEEVYLNHGQGVSFSLYDWDANTNKIYLGIKAPVGSGSVSINGNTVNINNATDCYYDISGYANITTDEDGVKIATFEIKSTSSLISVTNIKVTGNAQFIIVQQADVNVDGDGDIDVDVDGDIDVDVDVMSIGETGEEPAAEPAKESPSDESPAEGTPTVEPPGGESGETLTD